MTTIEDERYERPKFCAKCGKALVVKTTPGGFDPYTGTPSPPNEYLKCPIGSWVADGHSEYPLTWSRLKPEFMKP